MKKYIETENIRAELTNEYCSDNRNLCYVRQREEREGVISAIVNDRQAKIISAILSNVEGKTFSQIWDEMNNVKGAKFTYQSY